MKQFFAILVTLATFTSLTSCGAKAEENNDDHRSGKVRARVRQAYLTQRGEWAPLTTTEFRYVDTLAKAGDYIELGARTYYVDSIPHQPKGGGK